MSVYRPDALRWVVYRSSRALLGSLRARAPALNNLGRRQMAVQASATAKKGDFVQVSADSCVVKCGPSGCVHDGGFLRLWAGLRTRMSFRGFACPLRTPPLACPAWLQRF